MSYCKLYIDTNFGKNQLEELFAQGFEECVSIVGVEYSLFLNENYIIGAETTSQTCLVERSRFYAEIDSDSTEDEHGFNESIAKLIVWLRQRCDFVVASCEFEDYIIEATGWNWTPDQPLPPKI